MGTGGGVGCFGFRVQVLPWIVVLIDVTDDVQVMGSGRAIEV